MPIWIAFTRRDGYLWPDQHNTLLALCDTPEMREEVIERAKDRGGFSIWFEVFHDDADMRQRLIAAFPGTAADCFDKLALPIPRPGGII
ncbi:MAG: hypothetical protein RL748_3118 [Pseudomonadota bacterium]|jgi:hypothetical protein